VAESTERQHSMKAVKARQRSMTVVGASVVDGEPELLLELEGGDEGVRHQPN
jgi:hypothetical protein